MLVAVHCRQEIERIDHSTTEDHRAQGRIFGKLRI